MANDLYPLVRALGARRSGASWLARCPAHDDHDPSLAIREECGKVLVHCFAGCQQSDVLNALKTRGLWRSERPDGSTIVAAYDYTDEHGNLLYQVVRYQPKTFKQRRPDGFGGWIWKKGARQVLYRLREVLEAPIVFVVEGERDAETLREHGFVATTNAGGAKAPWQPSYTETLAGREIILIPDADTPGRQRGLTIARALVGRVARLVLFDLEGAKDITEWFACGHSEIELIAQVDSEVVWQ
jgi:5S rRNA maturation endonuclease (ribonuclease M5)